VLLDLLSQIEPDDSWRHQQPDPQPRPYARAVYLPLTTAVVLADTPTGHGPGPSGYLRFGSLRQYQATSAPVFVPPTVTVTPEWAPPLSLPVSPPRRQDGWVAFTHLPLTVHLDWFVPAAGAPLRPPSAAEGWVGYTEPYPVLNLDWLPPTTGPRSAPRRQDGWIAFVQAPTATPAPELSWHPQYPDRLTTLRPTAAYLAASWLIDIIDLVVSGHGPGPSGYLRFGSMRQYQASAAPVFVPQTTVVTPEWMPPLSTPVPPGRRHADWVAFTPIPTTINLDWLPVTAPPIPVLRRAPEGWAIFTEPFPVVATDWIPPLSQPVLLQRRADGWYAFVSIKPVTPTVDQLSAWAVYPDRLNRATLPPSDHPFFFYGTWVPIPNPPTTLVLEDRILIGQNQSIETPFYPSIGGSTTWS
jgi:hypothetical protein